MPYFAPASIACDGSSASIAASFPDAFASSPTGEVLSVTAGECIFLPRRKPHAWLITSDEIHTIGIITPGGFNDALNRLGTPVARMEVPADVDTVTYANTDLTETINGIRQSNPPTGRGVFLMHSFGITEIGEVRVRKRRSHQEIKRLVAEFETASAASA